MFKIVHKQELAEGIKLFRVEAPLIATKANPGQFVVVRTHEQGERIPLTMADQDVSKGTITLIVQEVGASTKGLGGLNPGDSILDLLGPLGRPTEVKNFGTVVCMGGGVGIAELYPITRAYKQAGNRIISILGARNKNLLIYEEKLRSVSHELHITTDDGSYGRKGFVSDVLKDLLEGKASFAATKAPKIDLVFAVGPLPMMKVVSGITRPYKIRTVVSLNPIMMDATGMCGACRVTVGGETRFACVDGPEFDGHLVDFDELQARLNTYLVEEKIAKERCHG